MQLLRIPALALALLIASTFAAHAADDYGAAQQLYRRGQPAEALARIDAALQANPRDARARFLRGVILTEEKRTDEAIRTFTDLTQDFPELAEPYNNLGVIYASQGDYLRARESLEMAVRANAGYATAQENLGDVYALLAGQAYGKAAQLDKNNRSAPAKLTLVREAVPTATVAAVSRETSVTAAAGEGTIAPREPGPGAAAATATAPSPGTAGTGKAVPHADATGVGAEARTPVGVRPLTEDRRNLGAAPLPVDPATAAVLRTVDDWAAAWSRNDVQSYLSFYAPTFKPVTGETRAKWEAARRARMARGPKVAVSVSDANVDMKDADHASVTFKQDYSSERFKRSTRKSLQLQRQGDRWLITRETIAKS